MSLMKQYYRTFKLTYLYPSKRIWKRAIQCNGGKYTGFPTDPPVCPLHTSSPIPQRPTCSVPGGRRPPGQRRPRAARRTVGGRRRLEGSVPRGRGFWLRPGNIHLSQDHHLSGAHVTPLSYIPQPCIMVLTGRKGFIPTNKQTNRLLFRDE